MLEVQEMTARNRCSRRAGLDARGWSGSKIKIITKKLFAPIGHRSFSMRTLGDGCIA